MQPKVSILLPNLNNRPFLEERIRCISDQTFTDWELVIVDNYSDDGAWEYFQTCAENDSRIKLSRAPRKGMYANWNNCIRLARGEYIYIATSDDTMTPDFLEVMVTALDEHPGCGLAHCKLRIIDENGGLHPGLSWDKFFCTAFFEDFINQKHIRKAPHDGLLHCGVKTVYTSITQLLIRRSLFDEIGLFLTGYGSTADFEWEMRASLVTDTIHIPQYLATWRVHGEQGTDRDFLHSAKFRVQLMEMIDHALNTAVKINPGSLKNIDKNELKYLYKKEKLQAEIKEQKNKVKKYIVGLKWLVTAPKLAAEYFVALNRQGKQFITPWEPLSFSRKILSKYAADAVLKTETPGGINE